MRQREFPGRAADSAEGGISVCETPGKLSECRSGFTLDERRERKVYGSKSGQVYAFHETEMMMLPFSLAVDLSQLPQEHHSNCRIPS